MIINLIKNKSNGNIKKKSPNEIEQVSQFVNLSTTIDSKSKEQRAKLRHFLLNIVLNKKEITQISV